jgi:4-amino-4-deoxy-L-arabinose transferase-like glycosyltransferase
LACATLPEYPTQSRSVLAEPTRGRLRWEPWFLLALAATFYFTRLGAVPFRGEETRWARVAWEMRESGDWIVPRQQGVVFPDRPPLNSWCMLLASRLTGGLDRLAVRLPAAAATLATILLLYIYCGQFMTSRGALVAGMVYATFPQTLQLGRFAESDALFALLATASLLTWHTGYMRNWPRTWTWMAGYLLAALAGLAKGPQGPVYFTATVTVYLAIRRDWRCLLSVSHAVGLLTFAAMLSAWQIPFSMAVGGHATLAVWSEDGVLSSRLAGLFGPVWWRHLASFPLEVGAYLLPWSVFLLPLARRSVWKSMSAAQPMVLFLSIFLMVAFPTCWLVTEARPRHLMAIFPSVACLIAVVLDRRYFAVAAPKHVGMVSWFLLLMGVAAALAGLIATAATVFPGVPWIDSFLTPSWSTAVCGVAVWVLAAIAFWARARLDPARLVAGLSAVAAMLGIGFVVVGIDHHARIGDDLESDVTRLKVFVLEGQPLVSFGPLFHKFTFYYQDPIEMLSWPKTRQPPLPVGQVFCFMDRERLIHGKLKFAWEEVTTIACDRTKEHCVNLVHVGRVVARPSATTARKG